MNNVYHLYGVIPVSADIVCGDEDAEKKEIESITTEWEKETINRLKEADEAYFGGYDPIMSDKEYDELYYALKKVENESGIVMTDSPTKMKVGAVEDNALKKVTHEYPALSLDKTKDIDEICKAFEKGISDAFSKGYDHSKNAVVMWKLDGSTVVATYENGRLVRLATRGNGEVGSDITHNADRIWGLPTSIPYKGKIIVRGEALMSYDEFERINQNLSEEEQYKNPRNLANATIQVLDSKVLDVRNIEFMAHAFVFADIAKPNILSAQFDILEGFGFATVPRESVSVNQLKETIERWSEPSSIKAFPFPVDGLVIAMEDTMYASTLPGTGHNPHVMNGYAFKWADEEVETVLRDIEWSCSRTGLINPVAVFDPVELEGTTVTRASLHNVSYIKDMNLLAGDKITVYKANKIIPQLAKNLDENNHGPIDVSLIGKWCPCCKQKTALVKSEVSDTLVRMCTNPSCSSKLTGRLIHFCDCMGIKGMGESTAEFLVDHGYISDIADLYTMADVYKNYGNVWNEAGEYLSEFDGWGLTSVKNLMEEVEKSKETTFVKFIHACGIPNVGNGQAKLLAPAIVKWARENPDYVNSQDNLMCILTTMVLRGYDFTQIDGFGEVIAKSLSDWVSKNFVVTPSEAHDIWVCLTFTDVYSDFEAKTSPISGKTFVITGDTYIYANRAALTAEIEELGGKVVGSVSKNTDYLINNDVNSTSSKNKKAKELGIPIISEKEFNAMI